MPRPLTEAELRGAYPLVLVTIEWAGHVYRWASEPVSIADAEGTTHVFAGELTVDTLERIRSLLGGDPSLDAVVLELHWPDSVAQRVLDWGWPDLDTATGEVALWVEATGNTIEDRMVLIAGRVVLPDWSTDDEPVTFTLERQRWEDLAQVPPADAVVSSDTLSSLDVPSNEGRPYPLVFGTPGVYVASDKSTGNAPGSPLYPYESTVTQYAVISMGRVSAATVRVLNIDKTDADGLPEEADSTVVHVQDATGRTLAVCDWGVFGVGVGAGSADTYFVRWDYGAAMLDDRGAAITSAGQLLEWLLRRSDVPIDWGSIYGIKAHLDAYKVSGAFSERASPMDLVRDHLLPILPVAPYIAEEGWGLALLPGVRPYAPRFHLVEGENCSREGRRQVVDHEVYTEITLRYARDASEGDYRRRVTVTGAPIDTLTPADTFQTQDSRVAFTRYGLRAAPDLTSDVVVDDSTARRIVAWKARHHSGRPAATTYQAGWDLGWLRAGDEVELTDADLYTTQAPRYVAGITYTRTGPLLELWDMPNSGRDVRTA